MRSIILLVLGVTLWSQAAAQSGSPRLVIELNTAQTQQSSCTLTFLISNELGQDVERAVYETVLFNTKGQVERLTLFDFGSLPQGRPRVRQFAIPDTQCDALGRILFNGAKTCSGGTLTAESCDAGLEPATRVGIEVLG